MPDYNAIAADNLNGLMREIAEYTRMAEEITATLDGLKDTLKRYMDENGLDHIAGAEHKATYKPVTSCRYEGVKPEEVKLFEFSGFSRVPVYKAV